MRWIGHKSVAPRPRRGAQSTPPRHSSKIRDLCLTLADHSQIFQVKAILNLRSGRPGVAISGGWLLAPMGLNEEIRGVGLMRLMRICLIAVLGLVAFLSLSRPGVAGHKVAQNPADATDASSDSGRGNPGRSHGWDTKPIAFVDEETAWVLPPEQPPEVLQTNGILQCVPFARFMSGIGIRGDAWTWWDKATGIYARGSHPEPGAVLSLPGIERMPLGHVAVVTQVLSARRILVDQANWPNAFVRHGAISRDVEVADVSPDNDWSEVRVQFGEGGPMGSVYPANGFIYEWNEAGVRIAHPKFSLDYALWSPKVPSWRVFNSISYLWALPPAERKKAYAAAGVVPEPSAQVRGRPMLVLGPVGPGLNDGALGRTLGVNRLDIGVGGRSGFSLSRFVMR
jgi:surface antigen